MSRLQDVEHPTDMQTIGHTYTMSNDELADAVEAAWQRVLATREQRISSAHVDAVTHYNALARIQQQRASLVKTHGL